MPFAVQHRYFYDKEKATGKYRKTGTVFIAAKDTLAEAQSLVQLLYRDRFMPDREKVEILDSTGAVIASYGVDYMAQFEAVPGKVWTFPSSSNPKKKYTTQINTTSIVSCNCTAWAMGWKKTAHPLAKTPYRHCKHTDEVVQRQNLAVEVNGQYLMVVNQSLRAAKSKFAAVKTGPADKFKVLIQEYEDAIAVMAALDPNEMYQAAAAVEVAKFRVESYMLLLEEHGIDGGPAFLAAEAKLQDVKVRAMQ